MKCIERFKEELGRKQTNDGSLVIKETRDHRTESLAAKESANQGVRGIEMSKYGSLEYWNERYAK